MILLILGLLLLLGTHSVRVFADGWRSAMIAKIGEKPWKGLYSLSSGLGLGLLIWGFSQARQDPLPLYTPPFWLRHVTVLLTLPAFILLAAANGPANSVKRAVGHPMVLGVKTWAFAHLLSNGTLPDVVLFGAFLLWSVVVFAGSRRRDRRDGIVAAAGTPRGTLITVISGVAFWVLFAMVLHRWLIGVDPLAMP